MKTAAWFRVIGKSGMKEMNEVMSEVNAYNVQYIEGVTMQYGRENEASNCRLQARSPIIKQIK